jgi:hypothetical protein
MMSTVSTDNLLTCSFGSPEIEKRLLEAPCYIFILTAGLSIALWLPRLTELAMCPNYWKCAQISNKICLGFYFLNSVFGMTVSYECSFCVLSCIYEVFMQLNLRIQAYFIKSCSECLWQILPKLRHSSKTVPKFSKKIEAVANSMQSRGLDSE